jgi:competence protein ComEC
VAEIGGRRIAYLMGEGPATNCDGIDILIAEFPLRRGCPGVPITIDRFDVWRHGAHAIRLGGSVAIETARGVQGQRPWVVTPRPRPTPFKPSL